MPVIRWRANAGRRYPQYSLPAESTEVYGNAQLPPGDRTGQGALSGVHVTTSNAIREHYDIGTERDYLMLVPALTVTAYLETHPADGILPLQPAITSVSYIGRTGTGTLELRPSVVGQAHTETGGNVAGSGTLDGSGVLSGTAVLDHSTPVLFPVAPTLTVSAQISHIAVGDLQLLPIMTGNSITTQTGVMMLEPRLEGQGYIRVQSGLWVVIPEDTRGWTTE